MISLWKSASACLLAHVCLGACLGAEGDWPQFRGPSASGVGNGTHPPVQWDAAKGTNIVWSAEIPGLANASPVVWGDRIFIATAISSDPKQSFRIGLYGDTDSSADVSTHQWKVLALDKKSGKVLWEQTAYSSKPTRILLKRNRMEPICFP